VRPFGAEPFDLLETPSLFIGGQLRDRLERIMFHRPILTFACPQHEVRPLHFPRL